MTSAGAGPGDPRLFSSVGPTGLAEEAGLFQVRPNLSASILPRGFCTVVDDAMIVPQPTVGGPTVVDHVGAPVVDAALFRHEQHIAPVFVDRVRLKPRQRLSGCHLFAGFYWPHFGHFLMESLSRLWAFAPLRESVDGIVFLKPRDDTKEAAVGQVQQQVLRLLGIDAPVSFIQGPTGVERLLVPRHGCGLGAGAAGIPEFREFVQHRLRRLPRREGAPRIYISRAGFSLRRGGIFAEEVLEPFLHAAGYQSFCPERETLESQISTYLGARQIISTDNSALHLFGFVGDASQDVAIVLRREDGARDMQAQIAGFTGRAPLVIDAIRGFHVRDNARTPPWGVFAELDFGLLSQRLFDHGYLPAGAQLANLSEWRRGKTIYRYQRRLSCKLREVGRLTPLTSTQPLGMKLRSD